MGKSRFSRTGVTKEELAISFGATGSTQYELVVPEGVRCIELDGSKPRWVVDDLSFIADRVGMLYHDADHYGITVDAANVEVLTQEAAAALGGGKPYAVVARDAAEVASRVIANARGGNDSAVPRRESDNPSPGM